jgi:hypothetical protein
VGKKSKTQVIQAPAPQADPALEARIRELEGTLANERVASAQRSAEFDALFRAQQDAALQIANERTRADGLFASLNEAQSKLTAASLEALTKASQMAPDAEIPMTDIPESAGATDEAMRRRAEQTKARRGRAALLIPLAPTAGGGTGLSIPG